MNTFEVENQAKIPLVFRVSGGLAAHDFRGREARPVVTRPTRASFFEAHRPHRSTAKRASWAGKPSSAESDIGAGVTNDRTAFSYRRPDLRIWASLTTVGQRTRKYNVSEVQTLPLAECRSQTHPDKQRGLIPVRREHGRVQLAHPERPPQVRATPQSKAIRPRSTLIPITGVSCAHTVSTSQNDLTSTRQR